MGLTAAQIAKRRTGITATDVRVLCGLDPYGRTPHDVWRSKVLGQDDELETEAMALGSELEPIIIPRLARRVGMHVMRRDPDDMTIAHPTRETHLATPDAFFAPSAFHVIEAIGQVKVCGLYAAGRWGDPSEGADAIPEPVLVQCAWELYVSRCPVEFVGALIGTEVRVYRVELTPDLARLVEAAREIADRFWVDHVLTEKAPELDGSEGARRLLGALWPQNRGLIVQADAGAELLAREYFSARKAKSEAESRLEVASQGLMACAQDADGIAGDGWRLFWKVRPEAEVTYVRKAYRHFDMRAVQSKKGRAA